MPTQLSLNPTRTAVSGYDLRPISIKSYTECRAAAGPEWHSEISAFASRMSSHPNLSPIFWSTKRRSIRPANCFTDLTKWRTVHLIPSI